MGKPLFLFKQVFLDFVFFLTSEGNNTFIYRQKIPSKHDKVHNCKVVQNNNSHFKPQISGLVHTASIAERCQSVAALVSLVMNNTTAKMSSDLVLCD